MFNNIKRVAAVIALTGWMGVANASLIFDFSYGTTGNELVGEITGLDDFIDGQSQSAESISITTATGIYAAFQNIEFDIADSIVRSLRNEVIVSNKMISVANIRWEKLGLDALTGQNVNFIFIMRDFGFFIRLLDNSTEESVTAPAGTFNGFVNRVAPTPAPEPSAVFLLALGLAGVSFSRYKKKP
jgi:hypothetical protein